jgi:TetR/AcrR family transcriptional regulator, regulator of cefoperazone and chloramphenicol sensitivity
MEKITPPPDDVRKVRADGLQSRERLLMAAMRLFAERGFAQTSTREIALAAGTNIASISYYFGDKAGLYRAMFTAQSTHSEADIASFTDPALSLRQALVQLFKMQVEPLKQGDIARMCMRLWLREQLEPTGVWHDEIDNGIKPACAGLVMVLARHLKVDQPGDDMLRLAYSVVGLAIQLLVTRDVIDRVSPQLLATDESIDIWLDRMVVYAEAMIEAERARLAALAPAKKPQPRKKKA